MYGLLRVLWKQCQSQHDKSNRFDPKYQRVVASFSSFPPHRSLIRRHRESSRTKRDERNHRKIRLHSTRGVEFRMRIFMVEIFREWKARAKPFFGAGKVIRPKSKQSRGNPKPISKELHSETVHVAAPEAKQPTLPHVRMPKLSEDLENLELGKRSILEKNVFRGYSPFSLTKAGCCRSYPFFPDNYVCFSSRTSIFQNPGVEYKRGASLTSLISIITTRINLYRDVYRSLRVIRNFQD